VHGPLANHMVVRTRDEEVLLTHRMFGGTRRRLVSPRVLGHRSVVAPSEQIDSGHLVEIDTPTRN
jgi:hypothetical protein